jgi:hypothetical protein
MRTRSGRDVLVAAATGFGAGLGGVFLFLYLVHAPAGSAVGLGPHGATFFPALAAYTIAYGGAAGVAGAVAGALWSMLRARGTGGLR